MKATTLALCALTLFAPVLMPAQDSTEELTAEEIGPFLLSPEELDELLGPIALHPDALVALILPAATVPEDIVLAARFLERGGNADDVDDQSWDESVKSLARYPELLKWLNEDLEWTISVGEAFMAQPADVMNSIQRLRGLALEAGTLTNTPQQYVVEEKEVVRIVPANPAVIYVPYYDPDVVYVSRARFSYVPRSIFRFSVGFRVGSWLTYDCDWVGRRIWHVNKRHYWNRYRDWRNPRFPGYYGYVPHPHRHPWTPPARRFHRRNHDWDRDHNRQRPRRDIVDSRRDRPGPGGSDFDRRRNGRDRRFDERDRDGDRGRRDGPPDRTRRRDTNPDREVVTTPPRNRVRDRQPDSRPRDTKVVSPRQNIINILRERSARTSSPNVVRRPAHTRQETRTRREVSPPQRERSSPRVISPRERVVNVLRAQSQPRTHRATRVESPRTNRSTQRQVAARNDRRPPTVIHGRTIIRGQSSSSRANADSQPSNNRRGRGRGR